MLLKQCTVLLPWRQGSIYNSIPTFASLFLLRLRYILLGLMPANIPGVSAVSWLNPKFLGKGGR